MNNQSEDRVLGTVGIYLRGEYDSSVKYEYMNQVTYQGSSYTCIKEEGCTEIDPTNEDYWICSAEKGNKGDKGDTGDIGPIGPKPINGVDYNTNAEREEFKNAVVADSKTDLEKYIAEKETHLDNYTKDKETKLDDYVTDTVKPTIDTYVTDTTKKDIDAYEKEKETALDTYTDTKKTEIDNYVANTSKPALDQYEKDKETELETAKNTAISEYDAHAESVLTETNDLFNALDTEKTSGTELYIEDAKPCRVINAGISGMYKQETTSGKNLLEVVATSQTLNGITFTINEDKTITANGTANGNSILILNSFDFQNGETYILNGCPQNGGINSYKLDAFGQTGLSNDIGNGIGINIGGQRNIRIVIFDGNSVNNLVFKPMIIKGSQATEYEPYTGAIASPNPYYQQEIEQVESVKLMCDSSNLFNVTDYNNLKLNRNGNAEITKTKNDFSFKTSADNYCGIYVTIDSAKKCIDNYIFEKSYCYSFDVVATKATSFSYGISKVKTTQVGNIKQRLSFIDTLIKPLTMYSLSQEAGTTITISNIKIAEIGDTEYTPYQNQTVAIDLKGNKLCAVSDKIKDKLLIDKNGNVALQKNVSLTVLSKDNIVSRSVLSNGDILYRTTQNIINSNNIFVLCNYYCGIPNTSSRKNGTIYCNISNSNSIDVIDNNASITTVDEYKTFVENNQIEVYYALATPELIDLGQLTELPKTFEGINNIWAETNLGNTEIEIEYVQDVKKLLEKQAEQQNARLDNIETLLNTTQTSALLLDNMQEDLEKEVE